MFCGRYPSPTVTFGLAFLLLVSNGKESASAEFWKVGFAKSDVTPTEAVRLSGYASRIESNSGIADPLSARAMVLSPQNPEEFVDSVILVSIDSIAVTNPMTMDVSGWLAEEYGIPRSQLVISSSHSHAAPHLSGGLENLFREPSTPEQLAATQRYTEKAIEAIKQTIDLAIEARRDAKIEFGHSTADFAVNRRLLRDGTWVGFGVQPDGLVDQQVRAMRFMTPDGELLGATFMYACHCTTLGPSFNQVSGDWAGLAAARLEQLHSGAVFLPVIGCGADANPNPRESYEFAMAHSAKMVDAVNQILKHEILPAIEAFPVAHFGFAGLVPEHPSPDRMEALLKSSTPNERRWAETMRDVKQKMGRLPESYPMPIHTWKFGEELTWVFLGGEVVAEYQQAVGEVIPANTTWVAAYCDDVFAYVASEAMRAEGGYEVDNSMIYYLQPGRWESGTQSLIVRRVKEIFEQTRSEDKPLKATEALAALRVPTGFQVEMVASEPLIQDPINIAFGMDGRVWVVEMSDYPLGTPGGGRIKWLRDTDLDGTLDQSQVFLDGLSYPTSVFPWRDGVLVIAAPDVIYAEDFNGDGIADRRETLLTGIGEANPQHRASGFELGLDGWLYFGSGDQTHQLHSFRNGEEYEVEGNDVAWNPDTGEIRAVAGETQFVRSRDAVGNWFGNSNSYPIYQYVIDQRYLRHGSVAGGAKQHLLKPAAAPPVQPRSRTVDRFNDQFARERFTSACSAIIARVPGIGGESKTGFICEPVHNLVARIQIDSSGSAFAATRHPDDQDFDFLTSTDSWSRPVRIVNAPDGTLWVVDMVRRVIEHPQWIPTAWQQRLDLRSGSSLGRIYRVYRDGYQPTALRGFEETPSDLLPMLASQNGVIRDMALQAVCAGDFKEIESDVRRIFREINNAECRVSALGCLAAKGWISSDDLVVALRSENIGLVRFALELVEDQAAIGRPLADALNDVARKSLAPQVDLQWVLTSTLLTDFDASIGLASIAERSKGDEWIGKAMTLVLGEGESLTALESILANNDARDWTTSHTMDSMVTPLFRLWNRCDPAARGKLALDRLKANPSDAFRPSDVLLLSVIARSQPDRAFGAGQMPAVVDRVVGRMLEDAAPERERAALAGLIGSGLLSHASDMECLQNVLATKLPTVRIAAIESSSRLNQPEVPGLLLNSWAQSATDEQAAICSAIIQHGGEWLDAFMLQLENGKIQPRELNPATIQQLRNHHESRVSERANAVFGRPTPRAPLVAKYLTEMESPQALDTAAHERNKKLFSEHCGTCHQAKDGKPALGPSIENLGHWTSEQWVTAILDPNQAVEPKFQQSTVLTADGRVVSGVLLERSSHTVMLATVDGRIQEIPAEEVEQIKSLPTSLMPEGFEEKLNPQQLGELIFFLRGK